MQKLGIAPKHLVEARYGDCKAKKRVERPDKSVLPEQNRRQALWWWKTRKWSDAERKEIWIAENHGEGVEASETLYAK